MSAQMYPHHHPYECSYVAPLEKHSLEDIYDKYMQGAIEILSSHSQMELEMVQCDTTLSCKNDIQSDDSQFDDQSVPTDHTNTPSMSKGDDEPIVGGLIEESLTLNLTSQWPLFPND